MIKHMIILSVAQKLALNIDANDEINDSLL